jgi:hypothetical protein
LLPAAQCLLFALTKADVKLNRSRQKTPPSENLSEAMKDIADDD